MCSGLPLNNLRSSGSWVATPTGQVLRWHLRIMMQPPAMSAAVATPNSSAPKQRRHGEVAAGFHLAVGLQHHAAAELVAQ